jgi:PAS domain S-box-containing protein
VTAHLFDTHAIGVNANPSAFLEAVLEASTEYAILATANDGSIVLWNEGARRLYGYEASEMFGRPLSAVHTTAAEHGASFAGIVECVSKGNTRFMARVVQTPLHRAGSEPDGHLVVSSDISDQLRLDLDLNRAEAFATEELYREHLRVLNAKLIEKVDQLAAAERRTAESLTLLETLQSTAPVGLGFVDREFRIRQMNESLASVNGLPVEQQLGRTVQEVVPDLWDQIEPVYRDVLDNGRPVLNQEQHADGPGSTANSRSWLASYYPVRLEGEIIGIGLVVLDITERKLAEDFRSVVMDTMAEGLCVADADGRTTMLNAAASRMLGWTEDELRGRLMHDAIHHQHADGSPHPREDCELLTALTERRAIRTTDDAFTRKDGSILPVACSAAPLLSGDNVRGMVVVFRDTTEEQAEHARVRRELDALSWVGRIRDALDEGRMVLYSQPIVPLADGAPAEELLIRMIGPTGNVIPPGSFLPVAERYGLITEIDNWVVGQAATLAAKGRRVEVNLSAESVAGPGLLNFIREKLHDSGARPEDLVFEITETALMRDLGAGEDFVRGVAELGCGLALDDFGTGFGSFTYLKKLSVDYLKIDIEFIRDLVASEANRHVVTAIVSLARAFGQQTIAEGVEDAETVEVLREYGVDYAQGYHFGRPAAIE